MNNWNERYAINSKEEFNTAWGNDKLQPAEENHAELNNHIKELANAMELGGVKDRDLVLFLHNYPKFIFDNMGHKILYPECRFCENEDRR